LAEVRVTLALDEMQALRADPTSGLWLGCRAERPTIVGCDAPHRVSHGSDSRLDGEGVGDEGDLVGVLDVVEVTLRRGDLGVPIHASTLRMSALAMMRVPNVWRRSWKRSGRRAARANAALYRRERAEPSR
jgi:hypothetical protein